MVPGLTKILCVEDEQDIQIVAKLALESVGNFTVHMCSSGNDALAELPGFGPDIILLDVMMPGMDGPSWVRQALKQRPDVRVVFVSGYAEGNFGQEQSKIPNSVFLPKPFSLTDLTNTVHNQLH